MKSSTRKLSATEWTPDPGVARDGVRLLILDQKRRPVQGAYAGDRLSGNYEPNTVIAGQPVDTYWRAKRIELPSGRIALLRFIRPYPPAESGADGVIDIPARPLSVADPMVQTDRADALYVVHPERKTGCLASCLTGDLGSKITMQLQPLCHVHGQIMRGQADLLPGVKTFACWEPAPSLRVVLVEQFSATEEIEMLLPPGRYDLESVICVGENRGRIVSLSAHKTITIKPGMTSLRVNIKMTRKEETVLW